jgi:trans-2-enoyl-CoA reductase
MLKLRAIAVVRRHETGPASDPVKVEKRLKALGAAEVLVETDKMGSVGLKMGAFLCIYLWAISMTSCFLCTELENHKFFAKPKLALDCVGGVSASRLAETLQDGCELVCFGCVTGKPVTVPWTGLVGRGLVVRGFSLRKWMAANKKKVRVRFPIIQLIRQLDHAHALTSPCTQVPKMLETLAKLVNADKIRVDFTEYELSSEFAEAMEHALEPGKGTKVLLRVNDVGSTYT